MSIYTKQGDKGKSSLNTEILSKSDIKFSFLGDVDELSSHLGVVKSLVNNIEEFNFIQLIQKELSVLAASLYENKINTVDFSNMVEQLEKQIDYMQGLNETKGFVLSGGNLLSAEIDVARTVARRAERSLCSFDTNKISDGAFKFLNRLSDFLFAYARHVEYEYMGNSFDGLSFGTSQKNYELSISDCKRVMEFIENKAEQLSLAVAIAFCDKNGNPILACSMKDALLVSFECAMRKAYTAVALKMPTDKAQQLASPGQIFYGLTSLEKMMIIPGGVPIFVNNEMIGGIGVSGGDDVTDVELAKLGLEIICNAR